MEGVEVGNEIWVWAGRDLTTDFADDAEFIILAPRRRDAKKNIHHEKHEGHENY
jgi:hypothetical protein